VYPKIIYIVSRKGNAKTVKLARGSHGDPDCYSEFTISAHTEIGIG
jgi:hypothetical protein